MKRLKASRARLFLVVSLLASSALLCVQACTDTAVAPPVSLSGPTMLTMGRTCLVGAKAGERLRVAPSRCEAGGEFEDEAAALVEYGYVPNAFGDALAVVDFNVTPPELVDVDPATPSVTHIPVGDQPREAAASYDGNLVIVYNAGSQDVSLVWAEGREELQRVPVGEPALALLASPSRAAAFLLLPDSRRIVELRWTLACDGGEVREGCTPELAAELVEVFVFDESAVPTSMALGAQPDRLLVTFADRGHMLEVSSPDPAAPADAGVCLEPAASAGCVTARYSLTWGCLDGLDNNGDGLIDADDPRCISPLAAEGERSLTRLPVGACADGEDNDGDGFIDAADEGCISGLDGSEGGGVLPVAPDAPLPACADGLDNDEDGLTDLEDPDCAAPQQEDESARPACADGLDNDADGLTDLDDPDCGDLLGQAEDGAVPSCFDGQDNDGDGAADLDDPACRSTAGTTELQAPSICSDGLDNDGDGLIDADDPDCYGQSGGAETRVELPAFGPIAVDPGGAYLYVLNRTTSQVVVIDQASGETVDVALDYPWDDRIGIPVGNVPLSMTPRRQEVQVAASADGRYRITRTDVLLYVATTRGLVYFLQIAEIFRSFDGEEQVEELSQRVMRVIDRDTASAAAAAPTCVLPQSYQDALVTRLGQVPSCDSGELASLIPAPPLDPEATITTPVVQLPTSRRRGYLQLNATTGVPERVEQLLPDDFYVRDETWAVTWEGLIVQPVDLEVQEDGVVRTRASNLCAAGVEVGDLLTFTGAPVPLVVEDEPDCAVFSEVDLTWRVAERYAHHVLLAPLTAEEAAGLRRDSTLPLVTETPRRSCFASGMPGEVRPVGQWTVTGARTGRSINQTSLGEQCVPSLPLAPYSFRAETGEVYANPFVTFQIEGGAQAPARDYTINFNVASRYRSLFLEGTGPVPLDIQLVSTQRGSWMPVVDGATNVVRVYNSGSFQLVTVLF